MFLWSTLPPSYAVVEASFIEAQRQLAARLDEVNDAKRAVSPTLIDRETEKQDKY